MTHPTRPERCLPVEVVAHAGGRGEEEPRAVVLGGARQEVREVLARWRQPSGRFFRVATSDGEVHVLLCRESDASWCLVVGADPR